MALSIEAVAKLDSVRAESMLWFRAQLKQDTPADIKSTLYAQRSLARYPNRVLKQTLELCRAGLSMTLADFQDLRELLVVEVGKEFPFRTIVALRAGARLQVVDLTDSVRSIVGAGETWGEVLEHFTTGSNPLLQSEERRIAQPAATRVAKEAGVSVRTVFKYRKDPSSVKPANRRAIASATQHLANI